MSSRNAIKYYLNETNDDAVYSYGQFLKEGEWEKYAPDVYLNRTLLECHKKYSGSLENLLTALWRVNRYTIHGTDENKFMINSNWDEMIRLFETFRKRLIDHTETLDQLKIEPLYLWRKYNN